MKNQKEKLYRWGEVDWDVDCDNWGNPIISVPLCPNCHCKLVKSTKESFSYGKFNYRCIQCDFKITFDKDIDRKGEDFLHVFESLKYKNAEIINIDGELIKVQKELKKDDNYWVEAKLSKNKKGETQLMVLVGSKLQKDKAQLFVDPSNKRLSFDQNNIHPTKILTKVIAIFKSSQSEIKSN